MFQSIYLLPANFHFLADLFSFKKMSFRRFNVSGLNLFLLKVFSAFSLLAFLIRPFARIRDSAIRTAEPECEMFENLEVAGNNDGLCRGFIMK